MCRNPAIAANPPKNAAPTRKRTWTAEELRRLLEHVRQDRVYTAYLLAGMTGMRRGEVLGLSWRSVDLDAAKLTVEQSLLTVDYRIELQTPKTKRGRR